MKVAFKMNDFHNIDDHFCARSYTIQHLQHNFFVLYLAWNPTRGLKPVLVSVLFISCGLHKAHSKCMFVLWNSPIKG